jgi:catalase
MKIVNLVILMLVFGISLKAQNSQLKTNSGAPVGDNQNSQTVGLNGPVLLQDIHLIEKLASFDRERIPERVVHARGTGAFGEFVAEANFSAFTKANLFSAKGKITPLAVRFSTVIHGTGSPETLRDPRGFALKFYTEEGNYDIVGNNLPVFFIRDAMKFPDMVHSLKPSPVTNKQDPNRIFDFFSHIPEATNMFTYLYSDAGIPATYRNMNGSSVHAFKWVNAKNEVTYVKYTWKTLQGEKGLTVKEAEIQQGKDFQHATNDLYNSIAKGDHPKWELYVQMIKEADMDSFEFSPLDATKNWPVAKIPLVKVGTFTLNRNAKNYFEEIEELAFAPSDLVPGIEPSEDRLLQGRLFSYFDTQRYRLGTNFQKIPVNAPRNSPANNYNQNGAADNALVTSDVNYQPSVESKTLVDDNTFKLAKTTYSNAAISQIKIEKTNDFAQAGELYRSYTKEMQDNLISNMAGDLSQVKNKEVQKKMITHFYLADREYGMRLAAALGFTPADFMKK